MTTLTGHFTTPNGSKYLAQLCNHFAHKIDATHDGNAGVCHFIMGPAYLNADDTGLTVRFDLIDPDQAEAARNVIDRHLERFAFREDFKAMNWSM